MERPNAWKQYDEASLNELKEISQKYRVFLDNGKTERECVTETVAAAKAAGYIDLNDAIKAGKALKPGDKVYVNCMGKAVMLFHLGEAPLTEGVNIVGAHIDSPRIDFKQNPFYEDTDLAYADTHYYGGIKKYQWVARPMALHGVVAKKDGTLVNVVIGEDADDPVVGISDILIHLAGEQMGKKASEAVTGEALDVLLCGQPLAGEEKDAVKANVLKLLDDKYGVEEEDFLSAELEIVPAGKARDMGFDRSMILGYGHDDRVCAYAELKAIFDTETPDRTAVCVLADKEEIGSMGVSGMQSRAFETFMADLCEQQDVHLRDCFENSFCVSADVCNAYDPTFWDVSEYPNRNGARANYGVGICKFTGSRGKYGANDAHPEYIGWLRGVLNRKNIPWQMAELGKVDHGGGGTVALYLAAYGMDTIDLGPAVLSMHSPFELLSKADLYSTKLAYQAILEA